MTESPSCIPLSPISPLERIMLSGSDSKRNSPQDQHRRQRRESSVVDSEVYASPATAVSERMATPNCSPRPLPPSILRRTSSSTLSVHSEIDNTSPTLQAPAMRRRRSSRVRFSNTPLGPTNPSPSPIPSPSNSPTAPITNNTASGTSEFGVLRPSPLASSPDYGMRRIGSVERVGNSSIFYHTLLSSPQTASLSLPTSSRTSPLQGDDVDAFKPRPLVYPKMSKQLSRLSSEINSSSTRLAAIPCSPPPSFPPPSPASSETLRVAYSITRTSFVSPPSITLGLMNGPPSPSIIVSPDDSPVGLLPSYTPRSSRSISRGEWQSIDFANADGVDEASGDVIETSSSGGGGGGLHKRSESTISAVTGFPVPPLHDDADDKGAEEDTDDAAKRLPDRLMVSLDSPNPNTSSDSLNAQWSSFTEPSDDESDERAVRLPLPRRERGPARSASPALSETLHRKRRYRMKAAPKSSDGESSDSDSDLDIHEPLLLSAVKSRIISPHSRLLSPSRSASKSSSSSSMPVPTDRVSRRTSLANLRAGVSLTRGQGWSGSEAEEDEYVEAVRRIALRHQQHRLSPPQEVESASSSVSSRLSNASSGSDSSSSSASSIAPEVVITPRPNFQKLRPGPITPPPPKLVLRRPSRSSSTASSPGDYPWGGSAPGSPSRGYFSRESNSPVSHQGLYEALIALPITSNSTSTSTSTSTSSTPTGLPAPRKVIKGWGKPEVLVNENTDRRGAWTGEGDALPDLTPEAVKGFLIPAAIKTLRDGEGAAVKRSLSAPGAQQQPVWKKQPSSSRKAVLRRPSTGRFANMPMI